MWYLEHHSDNFFWGEPWTYAASDAVLRPKTLLGKPNTCNILVFKLSLAAPKSLCGKGLFNKAYAEKAYSTKLTNQPLAFTTAVHLAQGDMWLLLLVVCSVVQIPWFIGKLCQTTKVKSTMCTEQQKEVQCSSL